MATTTELQFELQRRVILFRPDTSLPSGGTLAYDANPNNVVNGSTEGQTLLYTSPKGTRYQQTDGTQWVKIDDSNTWQKFATQQFVSENYVSRSGDTTTIGDFSLFGQQNELINGSNITFTGGDSLSAFGGDINLTSGVGPSGNGKININGDTNFNNKNIYNVNELRATTVISQSAITEVQDIKIQETSGFTVIGSLTSTEVNIPTEITPQSNLFLLSGVGLSASNWASFKGNIDTREKLTVYNSQNDKNKLQLQYNTINTNTPFKILGRNIFDGGWQVSDITLETTLSDPDVYGNTAGIDASTGDIKLKTGDTDDTRTGDISIKTGKPNNDAFYDLQGSVSLESYNFDLSAKNNITIKNLQPPGLGKQSGSITLQTVDVGGSGNLAGDITIKTGKDWYGSTGGELQLIGQGGVDMKSPNDITLSANNTLVYGALSSDSIIHINNTSMYETASSSEDYITVQFQNEPSGFLNTSQKIPLVEYINGKPRYFISWFDGINIIAYTFEIVYAFGTTWIFTYTPPNNHETGNFFGSYQSNDPYPPAANLWVIEPADPELGNIQIVQSDIPILYNLKIDDGVVTQNISSNSIISDHIETTSIETTSIQTTNIQSTNIFSQTINGKVIGLENYFDENITSITVTDRLSLTGNKFLHFQSENPFDTIPPTPYIPEYTFTKDYVDFHGNLLLNAPISTTSISTANLVVTDNLIVNTNTYLPLTGGTMSGNINFQDATKEIGIIDNQFGLEYDSGGFSMKAYNTGWVYSFNSLAATFTPRLYLGDGVSVDNNLIFGSLRDGLFLGKNKLTQNNTRLINVGNTWSPKENNRGWRSIAISSDGKYQTAITNGSGIFISHDYGENWEQRGPSTLGLKSVSMSSDGKYQTAVEVFGQIYISHSYGVGWVSIGNLTPRAWTSVSVSSDGKHQTATDDGGQIFVSSDYGTAYSWFAKDSNRAWTSVSVSSDGKYQTATVNNGQIYVSSDYGNNWTAKDSNRAWTSVSVSSDGKYQTATVNNGQIYVSSDYGNNWFAEDSNRAWTSVSVSSDGKYQTAVADNGQIYVSSDYGNNWSPNESNRAWTSVSISSDGKYQVACVFSGQIYISKADELIDANLTVTESISSPSISASIINTVSGVYFGTSFDSLPDLGQLAWHNSDATLDLGLGEEYGSLSIGEEAVYRVQNSTSTDIQKATVVQAYGVSPGGSGKIMVAPATATGIFPSKFIMGLAKETIPANGEGYVTHFGKIKDVNTEQWGEDGAVLYADPLTFGGLTSSIPIAPNNIVTLAIIVKSNNPNGTLFVRPSYASSINENESFNVSNLQNNETLVYNSALSAFENTSSIPGYVKTPLTNTPNSSAINFMVAVSALPVNPDPNTLYIVI